MEILAETEMSDVVVKSAAMETLSRMEESADKSNVGIDASKIKQSTGIEEPSVQMENSAGVVKSAAIEKHSHVENSTKMSNGEIDLRKIENGEPSAQMQNSDETEKSTVVEKSAETEKSAQMEKSRLETETGELILRLDPSGSVLLMCLASPLFAVLAVWPLLWSVDQPQAQALLWKFANLACMYLFLWIITLSTIPITTVFFRITYILMLAFTAVHLIGPVNGMIFLYTGMVYVAGMLGYAVAEHFQRAGFEQTAKTLCSTSSNSKYSKEQVSLMHFCTILMSSPILARMVWVFLAPYSVHVTRMDVLRVVVELTAEIFVLAVLWILYITEFIMGGALVSMETFVWSAFICSVACYSLAMLLSFRIAEAAGMLVMWLGWMAIGGFLGYSLAVRACYCKMLTGRDSTTAALVSKTVLQLLRNRTEKHSCSCFKNSTPAAKEQNGET